MADNANGAIDYRQRLRDRKAAAGEPAEIPAAEPEVAGVEYVSSLPIDTAGSLSVPAGPAEAAGPGPVGADGMLGPTGPTGPAGADEVPVGPPAAITQSSRTPMQLREQADDVAMEMLQMTETAYTASMLTLGEEDPILYAAVSDVISNMQATKPAETDSVG